MSGRSLGNKKMRRRGGRNAKAMRRNGIHQVDILQKGFQRFSARRCVHVRYVDRKPTWFAKGKIVGLNRWTTFGVTF